MREKRTFVIGKDSDARLVHASGKGTRATCRTLVRLLALDFLAGERGRMTRRGDSSARNGLRGLFVCDASSSGHCTSGGDTDFLRLGDVGRGGAGDVLDGGGGAVIRRGLNGGCVRG